MKISTHRRKISETIILAIKQNWYYRLLYLLIARVEHLSQKKWYEKVFTTVPRN